MSAFNPTYNPVGYPTDAYGQPLLENSYAPFYPGPFADQYVPHHWTPDSNQAFYAPSISQGIPLGWRRPPAFHADGNNPCINPRGYSAAPPNPAYLPPTHYYAYPILLQPQSLRRPRITIPPPAHRLLLKPLLLLGSKGLKPMPSNATKSSASSACPPRNLQGVPAPSSPT
ncbi:hypothetical protein C0989_010881 [Termitomyces sp. Mn162]|nr:hypothetical protein C0989_010881 [Termitomyces sp. Mn162]